MKPERGEKRSLIKKGRIMLGYLIAKAGDRAAGPYLETNEQERLQTTEQRYKEISGAPRGVQALIQATSLLIDDLRLSFLLGLTEDHDQRLLQTRLSMHIASELHKKESYIDPQGEEQVISQSLKRGLSKCAEAISTSSSDLSNPALGSLEGEIDVAAKRITTFLFNQTFNDEYTAQFFDIIAQRDKYITGEKTFKYLTSLIKPGSEKSYFSSLLNLAKGIRSHKQELKRTS